MAIESTINGRGRLGFKERQLLIVADQAAKAGRGYISPTTTRKKEGKKMNGQGEPIQQWALITE
jgi:hypothetical protein